MALFEMTSTSFRSIPEKTFTAMGVGERSDIQRLLRTQIDVLGDDLFVLTEEFGEWEDSRRRIDILAMDKRAQLVVVELKRTADGGHMELQAIRYASMVAAMTFDRAVDIHAAFLQRLGQAPDEARGGLLRFLGWSEPDEENFAGDVRVVLVSEGFSKELTTAVLWLRDRDIDIRCIRLRPYMDAGKMLVDVQQIIPLPEAQDYMVRLREKGQQERKNRAERWSAESQQFCVEFWEGVLGQLRPLGILDGEQQAPRKETIRFRTGWTSCPLNAYFSRSESKMSVWLACKGERGLQNYLALLAHRNEIEQGFGEPLDWSANEDLNQGYLSRRFSNCHVTERSDWPRQHQLLADACGRLYWATRPFVEPLMELESGASEE